jgi:hypothetical protein
MANFLKMSIKIEDENKHSWIPNLKVLVKYYPNIYNFELK